MTRFSGNLVQMPAWPSTTREFDAIVVPSSRPSIDRVIQLAARTSTPLVVLCSRNATVASVISQVEKVPNSRVLAVQVPEGYQSPVFAGTFTDGRDNDLAVKLTTGLLMARLRRWRRILYVNDDIGELTPSRTNRINACLDTCPVAATACHDFPDNSVVYHARRHVGLRQDVFIGGSEFGVDVECPDLAFFPRVYNEDWFFFSPHMSNRKLAYAGEARQDAYDPFANPNRATSEELGDLLAEGLYENMRRGGNPPDYGPFWTEMRETRLRMINETTELLSDENAITSLKHAARRLETITSDNCVEFFKLWTEDMVRWRELWTSDVAEYDERGALDALGLVTWARIDTGGGE